MSSWMEYAKKNRKQILLFCICLFILCAVFYLYNLPLEPVVYGGLLCMLTGTGFFCLGHYKYRKKKETLGLILKTLPLNIGEFPQAEDGYETFYQEIAAELNRLRMKTEIEKNQSFEELTDYYTMWVHQIKTPISAMRLLLQGNPEASQKEFTELLKIEQYVEMVLGYLRTEDMSGDMQFRELSLDGILREQIHKYARIFVGKRLSLEYEGVEETVLSDGKWLGFVIGQILSNALKYTKSGKISIYMCSSRPHTLVIEDTGMGIGREDLPRVFEKGYTGVNGRTDNRSTGIGLYLCAKIMKKLQHGISIESVQGEGTKVYLFLGRQDPDLY